MSMEPTSSSLKDLDDLRKEAERLSHENNQYLGELSNGEIFKMQLKETRKDAKHLSKQKKRLQAMADTRAAREEVIQYPTINSLCSSLFRRGQTWINLCKWNLNRTLHFSRLLRER